MNPLTARAVSLAVVVAVWTAISHFARLPLQLWPVLVGVACFVGSGGGVSRAGRRGRKALRRWHSAIFSWPTSAPIGKSS